MSQEAPPDLTGRVGRLDVQVAQLKGSLLANADRLQNRFVARTAPSNGQFLVWNETNNRWQPSSSSVAAHDMLSAAHSDTTPAAVSGGSLIVGDGNSGKWIELVLGASGRGLVSDGSDAVWSGSAVPMV